MKNNLYLKAKKARKPRIDPRSAYLLPFLSPVTYGQKTAVGVRPRLTLTRANEYLSKGWSGKISNKKLVQHFEGASTHYYWANLATPSLLMMGDVDCHQSGSVEGAMAFCKFLSETLFPGLYYEPSTNGKGAHFYFNIENLGMKLTRKNVSALATRLAKKLNELAKGFDIEFVEIKGHPPEVTKGETVRVKNGYRCVPQKVINYGQFAKIPRLGSFEKFERFKARPTLSPAQVWSETFDLKAQSFAVPDLDGQTPVNGSCVWVTTDDLRMLDNLTAWCKVQGLDNLKSSSRHVVLARDFAIGMLVLSKLSSVMKQDDAMRSQRIWGIWKSFYAGGVVDRAFDPKRWKVIRNTLSERGLLEWRDNSYLVPLAGKGRAMNWRMGTELCEVVAKMSSCKGIEEATLLGTQNILLGKGEIQYPEKVYDNVISMPKGWQQMIDGYEFSDIQRFAA